MTKLEEWEIELRKRSKSLCRGYGVWDYYKQIEKEAESLNVSNTVKEMCMSIIHSNMLGKRLNSKSYSKI